MKPSNIFAVCLFAAIAILYATQCYSERRGAAGEQLKQAQEQTKAGEKELSKQEIIYVHDTVRLTQEKTKLRVMRDTLHITDTVEVLRYIAQADSTIKACTIALTTCEQKDSAHKVIEAGLRRQNDALKKLVPSKTERIITATKWVLIGAAAGVVYSHK